MAKSETKNFDAIVYFHITTGYWLLSEKLCLAKIIQNFLNVF